MPHGKFLLHHMSQLKLSRHKIKCLRLFQNNNKIFVSLKSWDMWQHITCFHYSPKNSHHICKRQYVYDQSKDEGVLF